MNNFLPISKSSWDFFPCNLCTLSLVLSPCTPEKGSDPVFSHFLQLFLPQTEQTSCPQLPYKCRCSCLFTNLSQSLITFIHFFWFWSTNRYLYASEKTSNKWRKLWALHWAVIFPYFSNSEASWTVHVSQGSCLKITWREWYWACSPQIWEFLWALKRGFVLILSSSFHNSLCCEN